MTADAALDVPQLPTAAAERLRALIVSGRLRPNERVAERAFAERFGISRTPLREALQLLQQQGLVIGHPRRGLLVSPLSVEEITSTYQLLAALERAALLHTADVPPQMIQRLRSASAKRSAAAGDPARLRAADAAWHRALTDYTSNTGLKRMLETPRVVAERYERAFFEGFRHDTRSSSEHAEIEASVARGELGEAARLVEAHWLGNIGPMARIVRDAERGTDG